MGVFGGKAKPAKYRQPRALTSAAAPVRLRDKPELEKLRHQNALSHSWQLENWRVYDNLGEVNYAFNLVASALSRVRIHAAVLVNPDEPPTDVTDSISLELSNGQEVGVPGGIPAELAVKAREYIAQLNQGDGIATLLRSYALNKNTAGECYLCLLDDKWSIKSTFELAVDPSGGMKLHPSASSQQVAATDIPKSATVIRMWTRHPKFSADPDCSLRAVLFLCEQLIKLNRMINNAIQSRMNAGLLLVSTDIERAAQTPGTESNVDDNGQEETDPFRADLNAAMIQPIMDDQNGAAVVPLTVFVPPDQVQAGVRWISMARDVDQHMLAYAENLLTRILNGIPIPKDAITGFQNVRYANAQAISEEFFKQSVEPLALSFCDDLTSTYLQPLLQAKAEAAGWSDDDVQKLVVWYDPSEITTRPDRGADADAGWDRGALSDDAWRKAHGFGTEDAPSEDEVLQRTLLRTAALPPNLVDWMARELLPQYFKGAPPLVTKAQAGMSEADAATSPLQKAHQPSSSQPRNPANNFDSNPAGSDDQNTPPGGTLPPRTP